jgi:hypothetical protein
MPKPRLVVHIGMHKTGSTAIQEALLAARDELAQAGFFYPPTDRELDVDPRQAKHGHLCNAAWRGSAETMAQARATLAQQIQASGAHTTIVSEEGFSGPSPRGAGFFMPFTEAFDVEAVCYLRRQDLFLESMFNQIVKRGVDAVETDIVSFAAAQSTRRRLNYLAMLAHWRQAGIKLTVAEFDQARRDGGLLNHFANLVGLGGVALKSAVVNASTDMQAVLALCARRRAGVATDEAALLRAAARLNNSGSVTPLRHVLGRRARLELLARMAPMNQRLEAEFGVRFPEALPDEGDEAVTEPRQDYLDRLDAEMAAPARPAAHPAQKRCARVYIYTVPKAGTYLASAFVHRLGWSSSGWHIEQERLLQTLDVDAHDNRVFPSKASVDMPFMTSLRSLRPGQHAFGHFCPLFVPFTTLQNFDFRILCFHRHPRETLVSEFIDFRCRRRDVEWLGEAAVADFREAFVLYLNRHGPIVQKVFTELLLFMKTSRSPEYAGLAGGDRVLLVGFRRFLSPDTGPRVALRIARFLGHDGRAAEVADWRTEALAADNKTKATDLALPCPRDALWTPAAETAYAALGFDDIAHRLGY